MRVIIAGSRDITDTKANYLLVCRVIDDAITAGFEVEEVVSGNARGVDRLGEMWAENHGVQVKLFPVTNADWHRFGKGAGHRRNAQMANYADGLIAVWDGVSPGTKGMIDIARRRGMKVHVHNLKEQ